MQLIKPVIIFATVVACTMLQAQVYKSTDADGNVTYSDQPDKSAKPVDLGSTNSIPAVKTPKPDTNQADASAKAEATVTYRSVRIVEPANDSSIPHGPGDFTVRVSSKPELAKNYALQLYMDGKAYGDTNTSGSFALTNIDRGTHKLKVNIINAAGKSVKSSKTIKVHVFRPSILQPAY